MQLRARPSAPPPTAAPRPAASRPARHHLRQPVAAALDAALAAHDRPVGGVRRTHPDAAGLAHRELEGVGARAREPRRAGRRRRDRQDLPHRPVVAAQDEAQAGHAAGAQQGRLAPGGEVQRHVRQRDPPHGAVVEPLLVARRGQRAAVVEERVGLLVELAVPAARERDPRARRPPPPSGCA